MGSPMYRVSYAAAARALALKPSGGREDMQLAFLATAIGLPVLYSNPAMLLLVASVPLAPYVLRPAVPLLLLFVSFSFLRLHEAYPFLLQFSLPFLLGGAGTAAFVLAACNRTGQAGLLSGWPSLALVATLYAFILASLPIDLGPMANVWDRLSAFGVAILAITAFVSWMLWLERLDGVRWGPEMRAFAAFFIIVTIGMPFARELADAYGLWLATYWKVISTTLALAWLIRSAQSFFLTLSIIITSGLLLSAVAIFNGVYGIDLVEGTRVTIARTLYLTPDELAAQLEGRNVIAASRSLIADPNDLALVLLFPFGFAVAGALRSGLPPALRMVCILALPALILALVYTQSRGGGLGMMAVLGVVFYRSIKSKLILLPLIAAVAVGLFVGMGISERRIGGGDVLNSDLDESAESRIHTWAAAINMSIANPLKGVGMNNFPAHSREYSVVWFEFDKAVHNTWLAVLSETGIPGLIAFVAMYYLTMRSLIGTSAQLAQREQLRRLLPVQLGLIAGLAGFAVSGTFLTQHLTWSFYIQFGIAVAFVRYVNAQFDTSARDQK